MEIAFPLMNKGLAAKKKRRQGECAAVSNKKLGYNCNPGKEDCEAEKGAKEGQKD